MTLDELVDYCLAKPGATEDYPWGDEEPRQTGRVLSGRLRHTDVSGYSVRCFAAEGPTIERGRTAGPAEANAKG
jgi:hypothetical protein